ncbi:Cyp4v2 [Scenedesmus sp. PABB004]|nr:Cyp4v2 [Scenedesmus sp. PABB004]
MQRALRAHAGRAAVAAPAARPARRAGLAAPPRAVAAPAAGARQPPRPPELPGLGHAPAMAAYLARGHNFEELLVKWHAELGDYFEFQVPGSPPVLCVCDPDAVREVFEVRQWHKSPRYADLLPLLGAQSMVTSEGHAWRRQRDAFNPGFSAAFLKAALPGFLAATRHLVGVLDAAAARGEVVKAHELFVLTTLEVICKVGFGEDVDFLTAGRSGKLWSAFEGLGRHVAWFLDNIPFNWLKSLPHNVAKTAALQAQLDAELTAILTKRLADMGVPADGPSAMGGAGAGGAGGGAKCPVPGVGAGAPPMPGAAASAAGGAAECPFAGAAAGGAVEQEQQEQQQQQLLGGSRDILSLAVSLSQQEGGALDREMLLSQMKTFFAAGHDTTASLLGWTMYFLCLNPAVEARLTAEIAEVMGPAAEPTYEQLGEMRYLNAVLKESLRVRPPVGVLARWGPEGSTLAGFDTSKKARRRGGGRARRGGGRALRVVVLLVSPFVQHTDAARWGADAGTFRPERWLGGADAGADDGAPGGGPHPYSYLPFSRGPRDCIGARFALLEAKTILAVLLRRFTFEFAGEGPEEVMMSVTAHPRHGVPLRVRVAGGAHLAAMVVRVRGALVRFCQKCGRWQGLDEFDGTKRSCRTSLAQHNAARRERRQQAHEEELQRAIAAAAPRPVRSAKPEPELAGARAERQPRTAGSDASWSLESSWGLKLLPPSPDPGSDGSAHTPLGTPGVGQAMWGAAPGRAPERQPAGSPPVPPAREQARPRVWAGGGAAGLVDVRGCQPAQWAVGGVGGVGVPAASAPSCPWALPLPSPAQPGLAAAGGLPPGPGAPHTLAPAAWAAAGAAAPAVVQPGAVLEEALICLLDEELGLLETGTAATGAAPPRGALAPAASAVGAAPLRCAPWLASPAAPPAPAARTARCEALAVSGFPCQPTLDQFDATFNAAFGADTLPSGTPPADLSAGLEWLLPPPHDGRALSGHHAGSGGALWLLDA